MKWARSSAGEHLVDIEGVTGSIPVVPTIKTSRETLGFCSFKGFDVPVKYSGGAPIGHLTVESREVVHG